ncbi:MAG TPA: hypothetical protein VNZ04_08205 [Trinickia sp.]|jgi:hypothetical protein|nr:hypothetical protein [Trinickia sp.]
MRTPRFANLVDRPSASEFTIGADLAGGPEDRISGLRHFATILAADARLYVAGDGRIYAFSVDP